jgi:tetratricopeptide (TPR) repeat protein
MGYMFGRVPPCESMPKAKAAALRALEIDDTLAETYASLAFVNFNFDWDMSSAKEHFQKSFELNPNYPAAHHWYGGYLSTALARHDEAIAEARKGLELDPLSLPINHFVGFLQLMARRPDNAIAQFRKTLELNPGHPLVHHSMGSTLEYQGRYEEAVEEFLRGNVFVSQSEDDVNELRRAFTDAGWKGFLQKHQALCLAEWERNGPWHGYAYYIASNYARLGDCENALNWLERAYEMRSGMLIWLSVHFHFDPIRQDPRFADLLRRIGLASSTGSS